MNPKIDSLIQSEAAGSSALSLPDFLINLSLAAILAYTLAIIYTKYGRSLSNRRFFASNFVLITLTTLVVIMIVKSSLALSLGLVGALSIVRFRAAIKEPEELSYLFLAIAIGLGLGAGQRTITLVAFLFIVAVIYIKNLYSQSFDSQNLFLTVSSPSQTDVTLSQIIFILKKHCTTVNLKRFDENNRTIDASFLVEFNDPQKIEETKKSLQTLDTSLRFTFLDNKGIF